MFIVAAFFESFVTRYTGMPLAVSLSILAGSAFLLFGIFYLPARLHKRIDAGLTSSGNLTSTKTLTNGSAKIQLRKLRDFSQNISDTFQFIKQELKPLLTAFVLVAALLCW